jgi:hypothetical protein
MRPGLTCLILLLATAAAAPAQNTPEVEPIKLTLSPAAAASPALKYLLLPELIDKTPGNAALEYYRAFSPEWWGNIRQPKTWETIDNALQTPLDRFPRKELSWLENYRMLEQVDRASRREYIDWGMAERIRREGFELLLPDVQGFRRIATLLAVRARLEMAEGNYDKALYSLQSGLALGHHVGDGVLLIQDLVGMAIALQMLAQVEELIQQRHAPNLYWALTELPRPFFDIRQALQGEKVGMYAAIPELRTLETTPLSSEQQQRLLQIQGGGVDALFYGKRPKWRNRLAGTFWILRAYPDAKQALIAEGRKPEEIEALPALQVVLIHSWHQYQRLQDDVYKCASLPYWQAHPQMQQVERRLRQARGRLEGMPFFDFLPAIQKVVATAVRTDRRIAALRCVEAIRIHAASRGGKLPTALDLVTEVPIPMDPVTGKAFIYRVSGERAILLAPPPPGQQANPSNSLRYELKLRPNK